MNIKEKLLKFRKSLTGQEQPKENNTGKCVVADRFEYTEEEITKMMELMRNENKISPAAEAISKAMSEMYPDCLDDKVDDFIDWEWGKDKDGNPINDKEVDLN